MKEKLNQMLKEALKTKNVSMANAVRNIKTEISKKETAKNAKPLEESDIINIIKSMVKKQNDTAEIYKQQHRADLYEIEIKEIEVLKNFIPASLSESEVEAKIDEMLLQNSITSKKQFGQAMQLCIKQLSTQADNNTIKNILTNKLQ